MAWLELLHDVSSIPDDTVITPFPGWPPADWSPSEGKRWPTEEVDTYAGVKIGSRVFPARFGVHVESSGPTKLAGVLLFEIPENEKRVVFHGGFADVGEWDAVQRWVFSLRPQDWWKRHALYYVSVLSAATEFRLQREASGLPHQWDEEGPSDEEAEMLAWSARASFEVPVTRRRDRITDAVLAEVANVYRAAWKAGENPTQAVAHHFHKSGPTASRWVNLSRRAGHLRPSDSTRGGEVSDG